MVVVGLVQEVSRSKISGMRNGRIKVEMWMLASILGFLISPDAGWFVIGVWALNEATMWVGVIYRRLTS